jgi:transcriptional regulator with XRE-family HTH domain
VPRKSKLALPFDPKKLGANVRYARDKAGLGLRQLADLSQVDEGKLSRIERGIIAPNVADAFRICAALALRIGWLLSDEDPMYSASTAPVRMRLELDDDAVKSSRKLG